MPTLMPHPLAYVFKKELIYVPFFGWAMARLDMIHIDRSQRTRPSTRSSRRAASCWRRASGSSCFPKARAFRAAAKGTYKTGGTRLAGETGAPVVPIAVTSARCWPRKGFIKRPGRGRRLDRPADPDRPGASPTS